MNLRRWLTPGIGVKRWLLVVFAGLLFLALGGAHLLRQVTRDLEPSGPAGLVIDLVTLRFLPYEARGIVVALAGLVLVALGSVRVVRAVTEPLRERDADAPLVEVLHRRRALARGPRIVAIGGGTGLSILLRGLKVHTDNLTAIVSVADDGGSSGALRAELGIPAVGDLRSCIAALADAEPAMSTLLAYRFPGGHAAQDGGLETDASGLGGHPVGNLVIAALTALEGGDFEAGVRRLHRVLAVRGRVVPVSATPITLHARTTGGSTVDGQALITRTPGIEEVWISPPDVAVAADAIAAIAEAELIVLGPGSLYTSLIPVLLVREIREAIAAATGLRVYVANVATQAGETAELDLAAHVEALVRHAGPGVADIVLANNRFDARAPDGWRGASLSLRWPPEVDEPPILALEDVVDSVNAHHHDPERLAAGLLALQGRRGSRRRSAPGSARG